nr:hypothetical protein [Maridesulfovibrio zosterae]
MQCIDICIKYNMPATFFATHKTDILLDIQTNPLFELGIHPNFLHGSTHGDSPIKIMEHCLDIVPKAKSMRTHALVQSTHLFLDIAKKLPQIETDVSLFMYAHKGLVPTWLHLGESRKIARIPYFWEDDLYSWSPAPDWNYLNMDGGGLKIYNFHPVLVSLNTNTLDGYCALKESLNGTSLRECSREDFSQFVNPCLGTKTFLKNICEKSSLETCVQISQITAEFNENSNNWKN